MNENTMNQHYNTPEVAVTDNRGLTVRKIQYHRHPDTPAVTDVRITRHTFTARGQMHTSADPRLSQVQINNFMYLTTLSGRPLLTTGADNGTVLSLNDAAGRPYMEINATGVTRRWQYENADLAGRPLAVSEQEEGGDIRITERFVYAGNTEAEKGLNLAGSLVRRYDNAGLQQTDSVSLTGSPVSVTRRLLKDAENPDTEVDWSGENEAVWQSALVGTTYNTQSTMDATGTVLASTDAMGNIQRTAYDVAGLLKGSWLTLKNGTEQVIVKSLTYSAAGQKLREEHGNGVVTTYMYEPQTQRLTGIRTERPQNHQQGRKVLQDLRYKYDPVGNVLKVSNDAEATRYWRNQKVVPESTYVYDSLYQLVSATGREMANVAQQGTNLPAPLIPLPSDNNAYTNYTRTYHYDTGGNLTRIHHHAAATGNTYTTTVRVSDRSNRAVLDTFTDNPAQVDALFTAGGHQMNMMPGQSLVWTPRGELRQVRITGTEGELYRYDTASQRVIKIRMQQIGKNTQTQQTLYLPGLELRTSVLEVLHTITVGEAGRAQVRVLRWEQGKPDAVNNNQVRYSYDNLTGSSGLEVDDDGKIISMEEYYPYGGTAVLTARSQTEAGYKTYRYSGKERDATGLYYYGYRYYQPWVGRWLSADPAGTIDGLNLYRMCRNNPGTFRDENGLITLRDSEKEILQNNLRQHKDLSEASADEINKYIEYICNANISTFSEALALSKKIIRGKDDFSNEFHQRTLLQIMPHGVKRRNEEPEISSLSAPSKKKRTQFNPDNKVRIPKHSPGEIKSAWPDYLFHYTNKRNYHDILYANRIMASNKIVTGDTASLEGVYVTDVRPDEMTKEELSRSVLGVDVYKSRLKKTEYYFKLTTSNLPESTEIYGFSAHPRVYLIDTNNYDKSIRLKEPVTNNHVLSRHGAKDNYYQRKVT